MGRKVDFSQKLSDEDKEYLISRGRGSEIIENDRVFGEGGDGADAVNPKYDIEEREKAIYDVGGAPLPGQILDHDTGRVIPLSEVSEDWDESEGSPDDGDVDDDIVEEVEALNVSELKERLTKEKVAFASNANKAELQDALAIHLHDKRHPQP